MGSKNIYDWLEYLDGLSHGLFGVSCHSFSKNKALGQKLGLTTFPCKVITVTGTNGKGSCVAFLESILSQAGYKVGSYTSPHLLNYNERIRINGQSVDDQSLINAFEETKEVCSKDNINLNYFEFGTIAGLSICKKQNLDFLLLEIGLGGRMDPVNIVESDIAVITTISLDRTMQLGNTREMIGWEKAGIMRSLKPVICGDYDPPLSIFKRASEINAKLYCLSKDFTYHVDHDSWCWEDKNENVKYFDLPIPALPTQNAATALKIIALLRQDFNIETQSVISGLKGASLSGRFQFLDVQEVKEFIVDVAHNEESSTLLAEKLHKQQLKNYCNKTIALVSMLKDKNIIATFLPLINVIDVWYIAKLEGERAASLEQLQGSLKSLGVEKIFSFLSIGDALKQALGNCRNTDRIVGFGSFYTVAEILQLVG